MPEPGDDSWDQKTARAIRQFFQRLAGRMPGFDEWEQKKAQAQNEALDSQRAKRRERNGRV
jgi:hypothetical protein